jgi:hypothetical protein
MSTMLPTNLATFATIEFRQSSATKDKRTSGDVPSCLSGTLVDLFTVGQVDDLQVGGRAMTWTL